MGSRFDGRVTLMTVEGGTMDPLSHPKAEELESTLGPDLELWLTLVRQGVATNDRILRCEQQLNRLGEQATDIDALARAITRRRPDAHALLTEVWNDCLDMSPLSDRH
jgi:hypothetical protein